ncbi:MAG: hypothetical protein GY796_10200 [Chloroflexi bacterium]|nr:hypothetical protein [Chloroflexota bacterium]
MMETNIEIVKENGWYNVEPSGHLDQLFRQTRAHHAQLSQMADIKANMMLTLGALIITFSIGYLDDPVLRWPVIVMISSCIVTILSATYAVMPKVDLKSRPDLDNPNCNFLFFGSFMNLDFDEYTQMFDALLHDPSQAYRVQLREVYELGIYLGRKKYRYIRVAYLSFLTGLMMSTLVLIVVEGVNIATHLP